MKGRGIEKDGKLSKNPARFTLLTERRWTETKTCKADLLLRKSITYKCLKEEL